LAFSTGSFYGRDTNDTSKGYALAAADNSYKYYNNITWSMWLCCIPGTNKDVWGMWEDTASANRSWLFSVQTDGTFRLIFSWDGTNFSLHKTSTAIFTDTWKHVMVTFASGTFVCYVNNVAQTLTEVLPWSGGAVALYSAGQRLLVGSNNPAAPTADKTPAGAWNNYSLWNKVLSSAERAELYNGGIPSALPSHSAYATNCTNWWRMDQSDTAPTLADTKNGSGSDMTITTSGSSGRFAASGLYIDDSSSASGGAGIRPFLGTKRMGA
jgi:hypothetical protein